MGPLRILRRLLATRDLSRLPPLRGQLAVGGKEAETFQYLADGLGRMNSAISGA